VLTSTLTAFPAEAKSPDTARLRSLIGTAVPQAGAYALDNMGYGDGGGELAIGGLVLGGVIFGPVLGYMCAEEPGRGLSRAGIRAAVVAAAVGICEAGNCDVLNSAGPELALAGIVATAGGAYTVLLLGRDLSDVSDQVRARNQRLSAVSVWPAYFPDSRAPGFVVTWRP